MVAQDVSDCTTTETHDPATRGAMDQPSGATPAQGGRSASRGQARDAATLLPVIAGDGIQIESDGGAMRADGALRLLSLWGGAKTARYLTAQLATGKRLDVQVVPPLGPWTPLWGSKDTAYKRLRRGVSARLSHTLMVARECDATRLGADDRTFVVLLRRDRPEQAAETIYAAFLVALLDEPVDPTWAPWLWRRARARGEARPLTVWGPVLREAWECDVPTTLRADITADRAGDSPYGDLVVAAMAEVEPAA